VTHTLRHNGTLYWGVNMLWPWGEAMTTEYTAPLWMSDKQAATHSSGYSGAEAQAHIDSHLR